MPTTAAAAQPFHIGDLLTISTDILLCPSTPPVEGVYKILNHMHGTSLFTHQLVEAADVAKPHLAAQFPWLAGLTPVGDTAAELLAWRDRCAEQFGEYHNVEPIPEQGQHHPGLLDGLDPAKTVVVQLGADTPPSH